MKANIKIRIVLFGILAGFVFWLFWQALAPFGAISYRQDFKSRSYFITKLSPADRIEAGRTSLKITGDPVYFGLRTPRRFDRLHLSYTFRSNLDKTIIESGPLVDKTVWRYRLKPINNDLINILARGGETSQEDGLIFWQRNKAYPDLESFLSAPPGQDEIALYHYDWPLEFILPGYASSSSGQELEHPLQGAYQLYTYIKDEILAFRFEFSDLNQNQDQDRIELFLSYQGEVIDSRRLDEDPGGEDGLARDRGALEFRIPGLVEGLYKLELKANSDIITQRIKSGQDKLSFVNKLELYRAGARDIRMYTDSQTVQMTTVHPDSLQTVRAGGAGLELKETYRQYEFRPAPAGSGSRALELVLEKDGLAISGNGVWAFAETALINPSFEKAGQETDLDGINYIIAAYDLPVQTGEWQTGSQTFDLRSAYREDGAYQFIISIPGLRADDGRQEWVEISEIKAELSGRTLKEKIFASF